MSGSECVHLISRRLSPPSLSGAELSGASFEGANLSPLDLSRAHLSPLEFSSAKSDFANHVSRGYRTSHKDTVLSNDNLRPVNLSYADLSYAYLNNADLSYADLSYVNLIGAHLYGTNLGSAYISSTDLSHTALIDADLSSTNLIGTNFSNAYLRGTNLSGARLWNTVFGNVDMRTVKGLETVVHQGPSTIGANTLERSQGDIPEVFLRGVGLSDTFLDYARALRQKPLLYNTCFLSYSREDEVFAKRLYNDLQGEGVRCWLAPEDMMQDNIGLGDKVVLLLSQFSLESSWAFLEGYMVFSMEQVENRTMLFLIRLDNAVMQPELDGWFAGIRQQRSIEDFEGWEKRDDVYQQGLARLLHDLRAER